METIQNLLRQVAGMQWSDYLDIFLVALLIYLLLPMIKTTGTIRVVRVVVALLLITALTEALKLYTIHFLLSQILQVGCWPWWSCSSRNCGGCWTIWAVCASRNCLASIGTSR